MTCLAPQGPVGLNHLFRKSEEINEFQVSIMQWNHSLIKSEVFLIEVIVECYMRELNEVYRCKVSVECKEVKHRF